MRLEDILIVLWWNSEFILHIFISLNSTGKPFSTNYFCLITINEAEYYES